MRNLFTVAAVVVALASSAELIRMKLFAPNDTMMQLLFSERKAAEANARASKAEIVLERLRNRIALLQVVLRENGIDGEPSPDDKLEINVWPKLIYSETDGPDSVGGPDGDWLVPSNHPPK